MDQQEVRSRVGDAFPSGRVGIQEPRKMNAAVVNDGD
jgi:hypothetical protein